jgi:hypothetical protein
MGLSGIFVRDSLSTGVAIAEVEILHNLEEEVLRTAVEALEYAQDNAPWEDRTGDARAGLDVDVRWEGDSIIWQMFHTVDYGIYLETRWNAKFAIIMPTLELYAPQIGQGMSEAEGNYGG